MKAFLSQIYRVEEHILDDYISYWKPYEVPKKTIMTAPGETERFMYYVIEGIQKSYYLNDDKQHIIAFAYAPSFNGNNWMYWQTKSGWCYGAKKMSL
jgi:CRP-like cAMP-binding protein